MFTRESFWADPTVAQLAEQAGLTENQRKFIEREVFKRVIRPSLKGKGKDPSTRAILEDWGVAKRGKVNTGQDVAAAAISGVYKSLPGQAAIAIGNLGRRALGMDTIDPEDLYYTPQTAAGKVAGVVGEIAPDLLVPGGVAVKGAKGGLSIAKTAASAAKAGAATGAARAGLQDVNSGQAPSLLNMLQGAAIEGGLGAGIGAGVAKVGNVLLDRAARGIDHAVARQMADAHLGAQDAVINSQLSLPAPGQTANAGWTPAGPSPEVVRAQQARELVDSIPGLTPAQRQEALADLMGRYTNVEPIGDFAGREGSLDVLAMQLGPDLEVKPSDGVFTPGSANPIDPQMAAMRAQHQFDPLMQAQHQGLVNEYQAGLAADARAGLNQFVHSNPRVTPPEQVPTGRHGRVEEVPAMEPYGYTRRHGREVPLMRPSNSMPGPTGQVGPSVPVAPAAPTSISPQRAQAADAVAETLGVDRLTPAEIPGAVQSLRQAASAQSDPVLRQAMIDVADRLSGTAPAPSPAVEQLRLPFGDDILRYDPRTNIRESGIRPTSAVEPGAAPSTATNPAASEPGLVERIMRDEEGAFRFRPARRLDPNTPEGRMASRSPAFEDESTPQRVLRKIREGLARVTPQNVEQVALDNLAILRRLERSMGGDGSIYRAARLTRGLGGKVGQFLATGVRQFGDLTQVQSRGFMEIMDDVRRITPLDPRGGGDLAIKEFREFAKAMRVVELERRGIRSGMSLADAQDVINRLGSRYGQQFQELQQFQNAVLAYARDAGLISDDAFQRIVAENQAYVPFQRILEEVDPSVSPSGFANQKSGIHTIEGSDLAVSDPLESIVRNTANIIVAADKNAVARRLVELAAQAPQNFQGIIRPAREFGRDTISVMIDGKRHLFHADKEIRDTLLALNQEQLNAVVRVLGAPASVLRAGATLAPEFGVTNFLRDVRAATIQSRNNFNPRDAFRGMGHVLAYNMRHNQGLIGNLARRIGRPELFELWRASGGDNASLVSIDQDSIQKELRRALADPSRRFAASIMNPLAALRALSEFSERATRLGEFAKAVQRQGTSAEGLAQAALDSRDVTVDFARMGQYMKSVNKMSAFFNARVQGMSRLASTLFSPNTPAHVRNRAWAILGGEVALGAGLVAMNMQDERWKGIPDWEKAIFNHIMVPGGPVLRIPKPQGYNVVMQVVERSIEQAFGQDPEALRKISEALGNELALDPTPTAITALKDLYFGTQSFTGAPIAPYGTEDLPKKYQASHDTPELAHGISAVLGNSLSPAEVQYLARAVGGNLGKLALERPEIVAGIPGLVVGGGIREMTPPENAPPSVGIENMPVIRALISSYERGSDQRIQDLYETRRKDLGQKKLLDRMLEYGDIEGATRLIERETPSLVGAQMAAPYTRALSALRDQIDLVRRDPSLSGDQKRQRIQEIRKQMRELAGSYRDNRRSLGAPPRI